MQAVSVDKQADSNQPGSIAASIRQAGRQQPSQVALHASSLNQTGRQTATQPGSIACKAGKQIKANVIRFVDLGHQFRSFTNCADLI
jgi:hypothetical protein